MRVTRPPRIAGSTRVEICTAGRLRQAMLERLLLLGRERFRGRHFRTHHLQEVEQPLVVERRNLRQDDQLIALGEQHENALQGIGNGRQLEQLAQDVRLGHGRDGDVDERLQQIRMRLDEADEGVQVLTDADRIALARDVEERAGKHGGGGAIGHVRK
jgi:hypothetical protein